MGVWAAIWGIAGHELDEWDDGRRAPGANSNEKGVPLWKTTDGLARRYCAANSIDRRTMAHRWAGY
ncbi:MAG: hypothetical protein DCC68_21065 [Planctomycetota bacterium]|nr:MAG: hypothetical protein DCC68_21065 [Planctomycetota bacterium]